jgi:hypothetical protein
MTSIYRVSPLTETAMSDTARLALPLIATAQAQKHVTHNEALVALDALVHLSVEGPPAAAPPASPAPGLRVIVAAGATGAFAGRESAIAEWRDGAWAFHAPKRGFVALEATTLALHVFDGTAWQAVRALAADTLGVATSADAANRLAVASAAALFTHAGAGHRLKINKAATAETASIVFQNGFSGRAEFGIAGSDKFSVKVSADGVAWTDAMVIDNANGRVGVGVASPSAPLHVSGAVRVGQAVKTALPSASGSGAGALIFVSNEAGGAVLAFSDGAAWRRVTDRAVVS